jgi:hypothetical protein
MSYIGNSPASTTQIPYRYTIAGAAKTTLTGADDLGKALTYTPGYVAVYVNGVKLINALDYAATTGSSVVFVNAVQIGDVVEIIAFGTYSVLNNYRASPSPPPNPNVGDLWYDLSTGILAIYLNDGTTSAWMQIAPTGMLDPSSAAPLDALAYNGMQYNGSMELSQENGTSAQTVSVKYIVDGWMFNMSGATLSAAQVADAPNALSNSIKITVSVADPALSASTFAGIFQRIEGFRISRLAWGTTDAQPITIGFWSKIHRPGTYSVSVRNNGSARSYATTFIHNVADTWEYKTVTIPGDTSGTWLKDSGIGISLSFVMASGSSLSTAPNVWTAGNFPAANGATNGVAATSDTFQITGVVVLPGIKVPIAAQSALIMRPYDQELQLCQRYYYKRYACLLAYGSASSAVGQWYGHPTVMRLSPSVVCSGGTPSNATGAFNVDNVNIHGFRLYTATVGAGVAYIDNFLQTVDARL